MKQVDRLKNQIKEMEWEIDNLLSSKRLIDEKNLSLLEENTKLEIKLNEPPKFTDYDYRKTILDISQEEIRFLETKNKELKSTVETLETTQKRLLKEKNHILEETKAKINSIYGLPNSITREEEIQIIIQDLYAGKPMKLPSIPNSFTQQNIIIEQEKEIEKLKEIIKKLLA